MLSRNTEELFQLRNHSKILVTKIKKLKNIWKTEKYNEDIEGKFVAKQEENGHLINHNEYLKEQLKSPRMTKSCKKRILRRFKMIASC